MVYSKLETPSKEELKLREENIKKNKVINLVSYNPSFSKVDFNRVLWNFIEIEKNKSF